MKNTNKIFANNFKYYLTKSNLDVDNIAKRLNISTSAVYSWSSGNRMPKLDKIEALAELFGINKSDLLTDEQNAIISRISLDIFGCKQIGIDDISPVLAKKGEYISLLIETDYEPHINENDILILKKQDIIELGRIHLIIYKNVYLLCDLVFNQKELYILPLDHINFPRVICVEETDITVIAIATELRRLL